MSTHPIYNDKKEYGVSRQRLDGAKEAHIVYEPTGPYHRAFERQMAGAGMALVKVNPRHARCFTGPSLPIFMFGLQDCCDSSLEFATNHLNVILLHK